MMILEIDDRMLLRPPTRLTPAMRHDYAARVRRHFRTQAYLFSYARMLRTWLPSGAHASWQRGTWAQRVV